MERETNGQGHRVMVKDNYYARFHTAITAAVKCSLVLDFDKVSGA